MQSPGPSSFNQPEQDLTNASNHLMQLLGQTNGAPSPFPPSFPPPPPASLYPPVINPSGGLKDILFPNLQQAPLPVQPHIEPQRVPLPPSPAPTVHRINASQEAPSPNRGASPFAAQQGKSASLESVSSFFGQKDEPKECPGSPLEGGEVEYKLDNTNSSSKSKELEVVPITLYSSEFTYQRGNLIAVNENFICYTVRGGGGDMVRVLHKHSSGRDLLRGHSSQIMDVQFRPTPGDVLATVGKDGKIFVWRLYNEDSTEKSSPIVHEILHHVKPEAEKSSITRFAWHPKDDSKFMTAESDNFVYVWECSQLSPETTREEGNPVQIPGGENILDISIAIDGSFLAIASESGVKIYDLSNRECLRDWSPHSEDAVYGVAFCGNKMVPTPGSEKLLITGGNRNSELMLWNTDTWDLLQTIHLISSTGSPDYFYNHFSLDGTGNFLVVTNAKQKSVLALHLNSPTEMGEVDPAMCRFDNITEFCVAHPIISFTISTSLQEEPTTSVQMELYTVQTKAIQLYRLNSEQCYTRRQQIHEKPIASIAPPAQREPDFELGEFVAPDDLKKEESNMVAAKVKEKEKQQEAAIQKSKPAPDQKEAVVPKQQAAKAVPKEKEAVKAQPSSVEKKEAAKASPAKEKKAIAAQEIVAQGAVEPAVPVVVKKEKEAPAQAPPELEEGDKKAANNKNKRRKKEDFKPTSILSRPKQEEVEVQQAIPESAPAVEPAVIPRGGESGGIEQLLKRMEDNLALRMEKNVSQQMDRLYSRLDNERKEREKVEQKRQEQLLRSMSEFLHANMMNQLQKTIHSELENLIVPALGRQLVQTLENNLLKPLQENLKSIVAQGLGSKMEVALKESLSKTVVKQLGAEISKNVGYSLRQPMQESFFSNFQDTLVPAFEKSCQVMFSQINEAFERGLQQRSFGGGAPGRAAPDAVNEQMRMAVQALVETTASMTKVIVDTQSKILSDYQERSVKPTSVELATVDYQHNRLSKELELLVKEDRPEDALSKALNARNTNVVTELCSKLDVSVLRTHQISQYVLLSLVQQLGTDLTKDTPLKLLWLREVALLLDLNNEVISRHAPTVLSKLLHNLEALFPRFSEASNPLSGSFKMLMHIVNSLLK